MLIFCFLFVQTESKGGDELGYPVKIFLDFDPLLSFAAFLSSHTVPSGFYLALILLIATLVLGRAFCGWVCPLGTLHTMVSALKGKNSPARWYRVKYYNLLFIIAASLFSLQLAGIADPLSVLIRSFSLSVYPAFNYAVRGFFDTIYSLDIPHVVNVSELIYRGLQRTVLSFGQPVFRQGFLIGLIFIIILALDFVDKRFWCRSLCPLGALLGFVSRFALLKRSVNNACTSCGRCQKICPSGAITDEHGNARIMECLYCMDCDDLCPQGSISFGLSGGSKFVAMNVGRRNVVSSLVAGIAAVPFLRTTPISATNRHNPKLIRPPGACEEKEFLKKCVRCGECMKVCITNGLQPTLVDAGAEGIWTPILVPKVGYCEFRCTLCGQVCPTGAIQRLSLDDKQRTKIGLAMIDKGRCLPYSFALPCIVCEEVCPTATKAIWLESTLVADRAGKKITVQQPHVDLELCIGCGICEKQCPVLGEPAIYVINSGESRSRDNQVLLS